MLKSAQPLPSPEERRQMRLNEVLAQQASGTVGYHAAIMNAETLAECRAFGKQADGELLSRDRIIRQKDTKIEQQAARIASLEAEVARLRNRLDDARRTQP